jgi:peptidylprolyl isomerase
MTTKPKGTAAGALLPILLLGSIVLQLVGCGGENGGREIVSREIMPGLTVIDSVRGEGPTVRDGDAVSVHYTGWLYDPTTGTRGDRFDSSRDRDEPLTFTVGHGRVIEGWDEGLKGMAVGGKRTLVIAPELAYGERGAPPTIPPNATLLFDVELVALPRIEKEVLVAGTGPAAEIGDVVEVHYTGWVAENGEKGAKFDSSRDRNMPFIFQLGRGQVIAGWEQGVTGMQEGEKALLTIPPDLGYGERGVKRGGEVIIPSGATLIFEVELVNIRSEEEPPAPETGGE